MKNLSPKRHLLIANIIMGIGAVFAAVEILFFDLLAPQNNNQILLLILAAGFFVLGLAYRFIFVKCPYCHGKLLGSSKLPAVCPDCGGDLLHYDPQLVKDTESAAEDKPEEEAQ